MRFEYRRVAAEWLSIIWRLPLCNLASAGSGSNLQLSGIEQQVLLGSEAFIERMAARSAKQRPSPEVPRRGRVVRSLHSIQHEAGDRDSAIRAAYATGGYTLRQIGEHFGLHYSVVSRIARGPGAGRAQNKT